MQALETDEQVDGLFHVIRNHLSPKGVAILNVFKPRESKEEMAQDGRLIDEHVNPICMRYYYPDQFKDLITQNGFKITKCWGGYLGEEYGVGPELVVSFGF